MKKKTQTWLDKKLLDIESWGQLSLFQHLKDKWDLEMKTQRDIIFSMGTENYKGSNLETHDRYTEAVNRVWSREFGKLYKQIEEQNPKWKEGEKKSLGSLLKTAK